MRGFCIISGKDNYMTVFFELDKNDILTEEQKKEIQNAKTFLYIVMKNFVRCWRILKNEIITDNNI